MAEPWSCVVAQIGARMHFAVPRIFYDAGRLARLYTDFSVDHGAAQLANLLSKGFGGKIIQRLRDRKVHGIPPHLVTAFGSVGVRYAARLRRARSEAQVIEAFMWGERAFSRNLLRHGVADARAAYAFNGGAHGLFSHLADRGVTRVLEQTIAPKRIENAILLEADPEGNHAVLLQSDAMRAYMEREEEEWALADAIVCGSDFVRDGLVACGVGAAKCHVVPYGVDLSSFRASAPRRTDAGNQRLVTALFIGAASTRKGIWTLLRAMHRLAGNNIRCRIVGPLAADAAALHAACPLNTEIVGPVPRSAIKDELAAADIFCLPSICEGSATVIYEALAAGLPVITTHNAGSIVRNGIEGFIVPNSDAVALAEALGQLSEAPDLRAEMGAHALARSAEGSIEAYAARLIATMDAICVKASAEQCA